MLRMSYDHDPSGTVPYAAIQIGDDVLLYVNTALTERVDVEFRQYLSDSLLATLDEPTTDDGARIIDLAEARLVRRDRRAEDRRGAEVAAQPIPT